jgi:serine/threonine-protein kinase RsbW
MSQAKTDSSESVSLTVPCAAEYVLLCRLVVGALAMRQGLDDETVADLKVAVSEAFTCFLAGEEVGSEAASAGSSGPAVPSVDLEFMVDEGEWAIVVSSPDGAPVESGLGITILKALVDSVEVTHREPEGSVVRLVKRFPSFVDSEE